MTQNFTPGCQDCPSRPRNLLSCCAAPDVEAISQEKITQYYSAGQTIFGEGTRPAGLYCVHGGRVKITKSGSDGKEQIIRLVRPGDVLGYRALVANAPHATSAVALSDCTVCLIPKRLVGEQLSSNALFSSAMMQLLATSLGATTERMLHLAYKPVRERLAGALLFVMETFRREGEELPFRIAMGREDLAALVGTAKETVSRLLSELKDMGIIATRGSQITILKPNRLVEISTMYD